MTHSSRQILSLELQNTMQDREEAKVTFCLIMDYAILLLYVDLSFHVWLKSVLKITFHS